MRTPIPAPPIVPPVPRARRGACVATLVAAALVAGCHADPVRPLPSATPALAKAEPAAPGNLTSATNVLWFVNGPGPTGAQFGGAGDLAAAGDFDRDRKTDVAVFRPADGSWHVLRSSDGGYGGLGQFGMQGDLPAVADYDGDRQADVAVFRPSTGVWYVRRSDGGGDEARGQWGMAGDLPAPADYDGDGRAELAVYRPSTGTWWILFAKGVNRSVQFGAAGDRPSPADFDRDGRADLVVFRPSDGTWHLLRSSDGVYSGIGTYGMTGDMPAAGDYDGDGQPQIAVARPPVAPTPVAVVQITPNTATVILGASRTQQFAATPRDAAGNPIPGLAVTWSTSNAGVVTINAAGLATVTGFGTAYVRAAVEGRVDSAAVTFTVAPPVVLNTDNVWYNDPVNCTDPNAHVWVGGPVNGFMNQDQLLYPTGVVVHRTRAAFAFYDSATGAQVKTHLTQRANDSPNCVIPHEREETSSQNMPRGTYYVFASYHERGANGRPSPVRHRYVETIRVGAPLPLSRIELGPPSATLNPGQQVQFGVRLFDASGRRVVRPVTFTSSNPGSASVTANGLATAGNLGTAIITATSDGLSAQATVYVRPVVGPLYLDVCLGTGVPTGYITYDLSRSVSCGSTQYHNQANLVRFANQPIGTDLSVCISAPTPNGWAVISQSVSAGRCGATSVFYNNVKTIRNVSVPEF